MRMMRFHFGTIDASREAVIGDTASLKGEAVLCVDAGAQPFFEPLWAVLRPEEAFVPSAELLDALREHTERPLTALEAMI